MKTEDRASLSGKKKAESERLGMGLGSGRRYVRAGRLSAPERQPAHRSRGGPSCRQPTQRPLGGPSSRDGFA